MTRYFEYDTDAVDYLKAKDKKLGAAIDAVGVVRREMDEDDLFSAIVHQIIGQQISTAAQATIWNRMRERLGEVTPSAVCAAAEEELQSCGITFTKARYIKSCAEKVASGQFDLDAVREMDDAEAIAALRRRGGLDRRNAAALLLGPPRYFELRRFGNPPRHTHGVSPSQGDARNVRAVSTPI